MRKFAWSVVAASFVLAVVAAAAAMAQAPEGGVEIGEGTVMRRVGQTVLVDVKKGKEIGIHKFTITSNMDFYFYKNGKKADVLDLREGDQILAYRTPTGDPGASAVISVDEANKIAAAAPAPAPAPAAAPAPAPKPAPAPAPAAAAAAPAEEKPAELPKTGSELPAVLGFGLLLLAVGTGLKLAPRSR